jgi:hypothetical protein
MARFVLLARPDDRVRLKPDAKYCHGPAKARHYVRTIRMDTTHDTAYETKMTNEQRVSASAACAMFGSLVVRSIGLAAGIGLGILLAAALLLG